MHEEQYDIAIVGGGLAGLAASILLSREGFRVLLFEKEAYPFHRVCGEYISMVSWSFLERLGVRLYELQLPRIEKLLLTAPNGKAFRTTLPLGGFGISRYILDDTLARVARASGVQLVENAKVENIEGRFRIHYSTPGGKATVLSKLCCAAWGKRSGMDVKWNRRFLKDHHPRLQNFVGIKYHVRANEVRDTIALHNFSNGYAGFSAIEEGKYCFAYLTRARSLREWEGIASFEEGVLHQNPQLKQLMQGMEVLPSFPVTISQISFSPKPPVENGVLMLGDTAGMIAPLCGNGMSIALRSAAMAAVLCKDFLEAKISREAMEAAYAAQWKEAFGGRLWRGRMLQRFFGSNVISNSFVQAFRIMPFLAKPLIRSTHGEPF